MYSVNNFNPYEGYDYLTKVVNREFKIKVSGIAVNGTKVHKLVGVSGLIAVVGLDQANKLTAKAFKHYCDRDVVVCKLRRGMKVTFYCV